jgi:hypothetical protein
VFSIRTRNGIRTLNVEIVQASTPPKPSTACDPAATYTVDVAEDGPSWPAMCIKVDSVLRLTNIGTHSFWPYPLDLASCTDQAGVQECSFTKAGTVTFNFIRPTQDRTLTIVLIK